MICRIDIKNMMDNDTRKKSIFEHILAVCGYVFFCVLLLIAAGMVAVIGAGIAVLFAGIVLFGVANVFGGLVLVGIGIAHMISLPRASLINLGAGLHFCALGVLVELFLFWFVLDAVPWVVGKIRKRPPRVMAKDIRALVVKVLKGGIIVAVIGLVLGIAGVASGGIADIRIQTIAALKETREAMEDTIEVLPFSDRIQNLKILSFEKKDHLLEISFAENAEKYKGDVPYTIIENTAGIKRIKISAMSGHVNILPSKAEVYAFESNSSGEYQIFVNDDTLYINIFPYIHKYGANDDPKVNLYMPKVCEVNDLDIYFSGRRFTSDVDFSGKEITVLFPKGSSMNFDSLDFTEVNLQNGLGTVNVEKLAADEMTTDVGFGDMTVNAGNVRYLHSNISSGRFYYFGKVTGDMDICCGTGTAGITLSGFKPEEYSLYLTGTPVKMQIGEAEYKGSPLYEYIPGNGKCSLKADARCGTILIQQTE